MRIQSLMILLLAASLPAEQVDTPIGGIESVVVVADSSGSMPVPKDIIRSGVSNVLRNAGFRVVDSAPQAHALVWCQVESMLSEDGTQHTYVFSFDVLQHATTMSDRGPAATWRALTFGYAGTKVRPNFGWFEERATLLADAIHRRTNQNR